MWFVSVGAQEVSPVDFMRMNPYQMKANPATDLPYESVMSLVVGNIGLDVQNSTLRYDNLFEFDAQGKPTTINPRKFANSLRENNFLGINLNVDLFTLYRRLNRNSMLTFNYGVKTQADMKFNDGLFKLLSYGNSAFVGENNPAKVDLDVNAQVYQEFAVGYQRNITEQFSVGGRAKLLFGFANITTDAFDAQLFTDADSYALRLMENVAVRAALPMAVYAHEGELLTNGPFKVGQVFRNPGFGVDLAAEYRFNDRFSAVAAVHDLGFIHWGLNNLEMKSKVNDAGQFYDNGAFLFDGMDIDLFADQNYLNHFLDSLQRYFDLSFTSLEKYNTALNTNLLLRGNYDLDANNRFSLQMQGRFLGSGFRPAMTLAYSGSFFHMLDVCATYTIMPGSYDNIGLGIAGVFNTFHIYLTTNNIIGCFSPLNASGLNAQMGIVFNLWLPEKRFVDESNKPEYLE
jgi:hypothetical protein